MKKKSIENSSCRILVIDDDSYVAEFFKAFVMTVYPGNLIDMRVVGNLEEGRREIRRNGYDILFLDLCLPGADGLDTLQQVGKAVDRGKVVVITGEVTVGLRKRMARLGVERCLCKPFVLEEIMEIVDGSEAFCKSATEHCNDKRT